MSNAKTQPMDPLSLLTVDMRRLADRHDELADALAKMEIDRANDRREDNQLFGDKIERGFERMAAIFGERFAAIDKRMDEACGLEEHREFREGIADIRSRIEADQARQEGRGQAVRSAVGLVNWTVEKGWRFIVAASMAMGAGAYALHADPAPAETKQSPPRVERASAVVLLPAQPQLDEPLRGRD